MRFWDFEMFMNLFIHPEAKNTIYEHFYRKFQLKKKEQNIFLAQKLTKWDKLHKLTVWTSN